MPLPRFDTRPVPRPPGLVPPVADLSGVTELRLHGVGGTTPQDLLGDEAPQQVSGDRIAGFYRTADVAGRHVEAYSWGGLTSRSGSRVLWLLLFPFALANVAGWMCTPRIHGSARGFRLHRTTVRWAALGITVNLLLVACTTGLDLMGYQCGGHAACADGSWLLRPLRHPLLADHPGRRVLVGALLPIAVLGLLALLALRTINRYESARPPVRVTAARTGDPRANGGIATPDGPAAKGDPRANGGPATAGRRRGAASAAQPGVGLADQSFWDGQRGALDLGRLHIGAGLAFVALVLGYTARAATRAAGAPVALEPLWAATLALGGAALLGALLLLAADGCPDRLPGAVLVAGAAATVGAACLAAAQPAYGQPFGYLPGMRTAAALTLAVVIAALLLVLPAALLGGARRGQFVAFGPFVALTLSVLSLNVVLLGAMTRVGDLLGRVSARATLPPTPPSRHELYLAPMSGKILQYLTVLPLAMILLFCLYELVSYVRAGTRPETLAEIRDWYRRHSPRPETEPAWQQSALAGDPAPPPGAAWLGGPTSGTAWVARVARARRFARMPHDVDKLLTALAAAGTVLLVAIQVRYWVFHKLPWGTQWTLTIGSYLAAGVPVAVIVVLRRGWSNLSSRRRIGVLWDVTTFWPRAYHPLAPPSYAERAVPELQRRLWRIHDNGGRVVLAAHSQGTVLAAAALLQRDSRPDDDVVALVTFGSPLRTLYGWAFPAYFGEAPLRELAAGLHAWRNFHYRTDYIGGPVLPAAPPPGSDRAGAAPPAGTGPTGSGVPGAEPTGSGPPRAEPPEGWPSGTEPAGVDVELPDPATSWYIYGQPQPAAARHSGYWSDPAVWREVERLAAEVATVPPPRRTGPAQLTG